MTSQQNDRGQQPGTSPQRGGRAGSASRRTLRRVGVGTAGGLLVVVGVVLLVLPGPGLLVIAAGLAVLATEFTWAKRLLVRVRARIAAARSGVRRRARR